ncbi:MAG: MarR family transcriptional regulator [Rhodanobacteraceae bacterium]
MDTSESTSFGYLLNDVTREFRKHFDRRATRFELTRAQWRALKVIDHQQGLSQKALAETLEMEPIPIGRVLDRLADAGFVERRADPRDRRCWRLYLTDKAHAVVDDMEVIARGLRVEALDGIEHEDFDAFLRVLARIKSNLAALDSANELTRPVKKS